MNLSMAWRTTRAHLISGMGILIVLVYLVAFAFTAGIFYFEGATKAGKVLVIVWGIPTGIWWAFVSSGALKILRDADKLLLPSVTKAIVSAIVLQAVLTLLIPAVICALLGNNFIHALASLTAIAAGGLLLVLLPSYLGIALMFSPSVLNRLAKNDLLPEGNTYLLFLCLSAIGMLAIAVWRFYQLRNFDGEFGSWNAPLALLPEAVNGSGVTGWTQTDSGQLMRDGVHFEPAVQIADINSPNLAMRTCLGTPFMPLTQRGQRKQFFLMALFYVLFPLLMAFTVGSSSSRDSSSLATAAVGWVILIGLGVTFSAALVRLQGLYSKDNAELVELALLPGWKDSRNARRLLLTVVAQHIGRSLLLPASILFIAIAFMQPATATIYFIIAAWFLGSLFIAAGYGLNIISGNKRWVWLLALVCIAMFIVSMAQMAIIAKSQQYDHSWLGVALWIALLSFAIVYFYFSWRPFQNRAHPFLRN